MILLIVLLLIGGAFPRWGYSRGCGYYGPSGMLGLLLVVVVILVLLNYIPRGF